MRSTRRTALPLVLLAFAITACETEPAEDSPAAMEAAPASEEMAAPSTADAEAALETVRQDWEDGANAGDAAAVASLYTDGAIFVGPGGRMEGPDAIRQMLAEGFQAASDTEISMGSVEVSGDVAYGTGTFSQTVTANGEEQLVTGNYLVVLRRQPDGAWKIDRHVSAVDMPEQPAMEPGA